MSDHTAQGLRHQIAALQAQLDVLEPPVERASNQQYIEQTCRIVAAMQAYMLEKHSVKGFAVRLEYPWWVSWEQRFGGKDGTCVTFRDLEPYLNTEGK